MEVADAVDIAGLKKDLETANDRSTQLCQRLATLEAKILVPPSSGSAEALVAHEEGQRPETATIEPGVASAESTPAEEIGDNRYWQKLVRKRVELICNDATLESDRLSDLEHELADHKREACILVGQVLTLEQEAPNPIVLSLADKVKAIQTDMAALHEVQVPLRAVPLELVARVEAAEGNVQTAMAVLPRVEQLESELAESQKWNFEESSHIEADVKKTISMIDDQSRELAVRMSTVGALNIVRAKEQDARVATCAQKWSISWSLDAT
jgi:hypothetical protein